MDRCVYGRDYKPRSKILRNLLVGVATTIILVAFTWTTYDPKTLMRLTGAQSLEAAPRRSWTPPTMKIESRIATSRRLGEKMWNTLAANFRFASKADMTAWVCNVSFYLKSGQNRATLGPWPPLSCRFAANKKSE